MNRTIRIFMLATTLSAILLLTVGCASGAFSLKSKRVLTNDEILDRFTSWRPEFENVKIKSRTDSPDNMSTTVVWTFDEHLACGFSKNEGESYFTFDEEDEKWDFGGVKVNKCDCTWDLKGTYLPDPNSENTFGYENLVLYAEDRIGNTAHVLLKDGDSVLYNGDIVFEKMSEDYDYYQQGVALFGFTTELDRGWGRMIQISINHISVNSSATMGGFSFVKQ